MHTYNYNNIGYTYIAYICVELTFFCRISFNQGEAIILVNNVEELMAEVIMVEE
jgi:hypothetical protein